MMLQFLKSGFRQEDINTARAEFRQAQANLELAQTRLSYATITSPVTGVVLARPMEPGHIMNIDFGVKKDDYCSDLQRTWYFLRPGESTAPEAVQRGFDTIVEAIREAGNAVRPGKTGAEIDDVARGYITDRGYPEYPHGLGHQIRRNAHDGGAGLFPRWERYGDLPNQPIEKGQCFTIEPRLPVEEIVPAEATRAVNRRYLESIRPRAAALARRYPARARALRAYVERQELESEILETKVTGAVWLLRRAEV